jgi:peptide subunit release factor RF-3
MSGFFGVASKTDCVLDLFFGVDYHSHLGTRRAGMAVHGDKGFSRAIHNIENTPFRTKFDKDLEKFDGNLGIGCISDNEAQPLLVKSHLGSFAITTVGRINNINELQELCFQRGTTHFLEMSTPPLARESDKGLIDPVENDFSAFVFKIQANMNKAHRDRIAFMRIVSGKFEKGMEVFHVQQNKKIKLSQPQQFMAQDREIVENAYAGDVIGVFDPGVFSIGDTLCCGKPFTFKPIPTFAPEHFARVVQKDTMKRKQFTKGITQIAQEGAIQIFQEPQGGMDDIIVGVVGVLQFEVLEHRLKTEYGVEILMTPLSYQYIRWVDNEGLDPRTLNLSSDTKIVTDLKNRYLLLFSNSWGVRWATEHNNGLLLSEFSR